MNLIVHPIRSMTTSKTSLWSGNKTTSGTLTLADDVRNYDYLIIVTQTNVDVYSDIVMVGYASSYVLQHSAGSGNNDNFPQYRSAFNFTFSDYTHLAISSVLYNNVNWQLGIREVFGVKVQYHSVQELGYVTGWIYLKDISWTQTGAGKYYGTLSNYNITVPAGRTPIFVVMQDFTYFRSSDVVIPYLYNDKIYMQSNTNSFYSTNTGIQYKLFYI